MPTGYTAGVADGTVTDFPKFAMGCARAFGALITMRDEPNGADIPDEFKPSDYNLKALEKATERFHRLVAMTDEQAESEEWAERLRLDEENERREKRRVAEHGRYKSMLAQVEAWKPPTSEHENLKQFMRSQLLESAKFDCSPITLNRPAKTGSQWRAEQIADAEREIAYHTKAHADEVRRCADRTAWVRQLRASLTERREQ